MKHWSFVAGRWPLHREKRRPQDWAMTQNNLAVALGNLSVRASREQAAQYLEQSYLEQSVAACWAALEVYTREQFPQDWAATQNNLGNVLAVLGERASGEPTAQYLEQSAAAFRPALGVYAREQLPQDSAATQNSLGSVPENLGERAEPRTSCAVFRAVGSRFSGSLGSLHAGAIARSSGR